MHRPPQCLPPFEPAAVLPHQPETGAGAIADFDTAIRLDPKEPLAYYNRACGLYRRGDLDKAVSDLDRALSLKKDYTAASSARDHILKQITESESPLGFVGQR